MIKSFQPIIFNIIFKIKIYCSYIYFNILSNPNWLCIRNIKHTCCFYVFKIIVVSFISCKIEKILHPQFSNVKSTLSWSLFHKKMYGFFMYCHIEINYICFKNCPHDTNILLSTSHILVKLVTNVVILLRKKFGTMYAIVDHFLIREKLENINALIVV